MPHAQARGDGPNRVESQRPQLRRISTTTGLLVDIGMLNGVRIDRQTGTGVTGGAALNGDLFRATADGPLFLPAGTCLGVGIGGLALGGGIGYNTHWAGLTLCTHAFPRLGAWCLVLSTETVMRYATANNAQAGICS
jgi:FAD/FMN-containing dehydrogenase